MIIRRKPSTSETACLGLHPQTQSRPAGVDSPPTGKKSASTFPMSSNNTLSKIAAFCLLFLTGSYIYINPSKQEEKGTEQDPQVQITDIVNHSSNKKSAEIDRRLSEMKKGLFKNNILLTLDELDDLHDAAYRVGKGIPTQMLMGERLEAEIFPLLWHHVFVAHPDKVITAEFTEPGEFTPGSDFGRGLRLVLRKKVGDLNISTILFLDYNEKTKKLEFPTDFYFKNGLVPDVMRTLIEYDLPPTKEELKGRPLSRYADHVNSEFFGTTISAKVDNKTQRVTGLSIQPTRDADDEAPLGIDGQGLAVTSLLSCIGCHDHNENKREGFIGTSTSFAEFQGSLHLPHHQKLVRGDFLKYVGKKRFDSAEERIKVLANLEIILSSPKENLSSLLPSGFLESLEREQSIRTSSVLNRYNAINLNTLNLRGLAKAN